MSKAIFLDIDGVLNSNFWNDSHQTASCENRSDNRTDQGECKTSCKDSIRAIKKLIYFKE